MKAEGMMMSVAVAALILCSILLTSEAYPSTPLVKTIYTIPEGKVSAGARAQACQSEDWYRSEVFEIGLGILSDLTVWYSFTYYSGDLYQPAPGRPGDSFLSVWYYAGNYFDNSMHAGFLARSRIPTGKDVYNAREYRPEELGNNQLLLGPVILLNPRKVSIHLNFFYVFREQPGESMSLLGINPRANDSFLSARKMSNDYVAGACSIATGVAYPFVLHGGIRAARLLSSSAVIAGDNRSVLVEGLAPLNAVACEAGLRFFVTDDLYIGLRGMYNLNHDVDHAVKRSAGFEFAWEF